MRGKIKHLNVKLENIMMYALVGGMEVPPGACGYKRGVAGQNPIKENSGQIPIYRA